MRSVVVLPLLAACFEFEGGGQTPPPDGAGDGAPVNDAPVSDAPIDVALGCASNYVTISGGQAGHKYKLISNTNSWTNQHTLQCLPEGAYLAIANDSSELAAIRAFAGLVETWSGVSDQEGVPPGATEGTFVDVLSVIYATGCSLDCIGPGGIDIIGNKAPEDCVLTGSDTHLELRSCGENHPAVCECEE